MTARCPVCDQVVDTKASGAAQAFVPHFLKEGQRKICPNSGKPVPAESAPAPAKPPPSPIQRPVTSKNLSAYLTTDFHKVVSCRRHAEPSIEELTLEYLDKSDRIRLQIEALREILGPTFRMQDYPPELHKPHLAVWGTADHFVVAQRHNQGGYQALADGEVSFVLEDIRQHHKLFFTPSW
jgi:hypothetical protein